MHQETSGEKPWITHPIDLPMDARLIVYIRTTVKSVSTLLEMGKIPGEGYRNLVDASSEICQGVRPILNEMIEENTPNLDKLASRVTMPLMFFVPTPILRVISFF